MICRKSDVIDCVHENSYKQSELYCVVHTVMQVFSALVGYTCTELLRHSEVLLSLVTVLQSNKYFIKNLSQHFAAVSCAFDVTHTCKLQITELVE